MVRDIKKEMGVFRLQKLISCVIFTNVSMAICLLRNPLIHIQALELKKEGIY